MARILAAVGALGFLWFLSLLVVTQGIEKEIFYEKIISLILGAFFGILGVSLMIFLLKEK